MRAFAVDAFGEAGSIRELADPVPGEGEVLIGVKAAGVSTTDLAIMAGYMKDYYPHQFPVIPGIDVSGVVEAIGPGVDGYSPGDEVFGFQKKMVMGVGTFAERVAVPAAGLEHRPASLSDSQAGVIAHGALTALATTEAAAVAPGGLLVLLGATGGVGSYATQLAALAGVKVIAVTIGDYADYARSLGAADVVDYTAGDAIATIRERYPDGADAMIDLVGMPDLSVGAASLVHSGGRVVSVVMPPDVEGLAARLVVGMLTTRIAAEHRFPEIAARIASGEIKLPAIRAFPFENIGEALGIQATRHVMGKQVLTF